MKTLSIYLLAFLTAGMVVSLFWSFIVGVLIPVLKSLNVRRLISSALRLYFIITVLYILFATFGCSADLCPAYQKKNPEAWRQFNSCIEFHPSDFVCDSCYQAIFKN